MIGCVLRRHMHKECDVMPELKHKTLDGFRTTSTESLDRTEIEHGRY